MYVKMIFMYVHACEILTRDYVVLTFEKSSLSFGLIKLLNISVMFRVMPNCSIVFKIMKIETGIKKMKSVLYYLY